MSIINSLIGIISSAKDRDALIFDDQTYSYDDLSKLIYNASLEIKKQIKKSGAVVFLYADYTPHSIAALIALMNLKKIVVLISPSSHINYQQSLEITQADYSIHIKNEQMEFFKNTVNNENLSANQYWGELRAREHAGLVLFSSGSTGKPKAIVHDVELLLNKFLQKKRVARVVGFLMFDHIGGVNTLFHTLFNQGCFIILKDRFPKTVLESIEKNQASALTTTPTFLNLLLLSGIDHQYQTQSLKHINFSTEKMHGTVLKKLKNLFPAVRFSQSYGLSETGVLPIVSDQSDEVWIKIDTNRCQYRVVDSLLEIKTQSSMLGYLNAKKSFTSDGFYQTGDQVEERDGRIRILGRRSELINVGGEKVYPSEIEEVVESMPGVFQASVTSEPNLLIGSLIVLTVFLKNTQEGTDEFKLRMHRFCKALLPSYKIPKKIIISTAPLHGERFKKIRTQRVRLV